MIEVRNLTKRYGSFLAVNDISFAVDRGGVVGFLGPNGAGKTTTIRTLSCYHPATGGAATGGGEGVLPTQGDELDARAVAESEVEQIDGVLVGAALDGQIAG